MSRDQQAGRTTPRREDVMDIYPLSPMQMGMLYSHLSEERDPYVRQMVFELDGPVESDRVRLAFKALIEHHQMLRTVFVHENLKSPAQVVLKQAEAQLLELDWTDRSEDDLTRLCQDEKNKGFDLLKGPLLRLHLLKVSEEQHLMIWTYHHLVLDGWSLGLLVKDFLTHYQSRELSRQSISTSFGDYMRWCQKQDDQKALNHWKALLEGYETPAGVPKTAQREGAAVPGYVLHRFLINEDLTVALNKLAGKWNITLNAVIQTLWGILLQRYNGLDDVVFGTVLSGRAGEFEGLDQLVGMFINTVPVRVQCKDELSIKDLAREVHHQIAMANSNGHVSLADIQQKSLLKEGLIDHFLEFQNYPSDPFSNLVSEVGFQMKLKSYEEATEYGLHTSVYPTDVGLEFQIRYNTEKYLPEFIHRIEIHLHQLINGLLENNELTNRQAAIISPEERQHIFEEFNDTADDRGNDITLLDAFLDKVQESPSATFLSFEKQHFSYEEIDRQSNKVAAFLSGHDMPSEATVGLMLERSPWMVSCIIGIWKAGGAYIPLEVSFPAERVQTIIESAGVFALITATPELAGKAGKNFGGHILTASNELEVSDQPFSMDERPKPEHLAYVMYTSGSTGTPKGAMVEHWGLLNHIRAKIQDLEMDEESILAQNASHCFDISVWQFFSPVVTGKWTVIYPEEMVFDADQFLELTATEKITVMEVVPSFLQLLVEHITQHSELSEMLATVKFMLVTGEELRKSTAQQWFELFPGIPLVNAYGATEVSDDVTHCVIPQVPREEPVSLGKPVRNFQVLILDHLGQPAPIGVKGEIVYIGKGVGRGYLNDPERTRQAFYESPFPEGDGQRMYRSGDIGAWLERGEPQFFGRLDHQVQVHGHRVEVGEVENTLLKHEQVRECVVVAQKGDDGSDFLIAYYTAGQPIIYSVLETFLKDYLPAYMLPYQWMQLERMPVNANGKVDRKKLPQPGASDHNTPPAEAVTLTESEGTLAAIWQELLKGKDFQREDNFFQRGGHSLTAIRLMAAIQRTFGFKPALKDLYKFPTLREMAAYATRGSSFDPLEVKASPEADHYPLTIAQQKLWLAGKKDGNAASMNEFAGMEIRGTLAEERMRKAVDQLFERHEALRTSIRSIDGEARMIVNPAEKSLLHEVDFRNEDNAQQCAEDFMRKAIGTEFDLEGAMPCSVYIIRLEESRFQLLLVLHHIVGDAWSMATILSDLLRLYIPGASIEPLELQFRDYALWEKDFLDHPHSEESKEFWKRQLGEPTSQKNGLYEKDNADSSAYDGSQIEIPLSPALKQAFKSFTTEANTSSFITVFSALAVYWFRVTGQTSFVLGTPMSGRNLAGLQEQVGLFMNLVPIRIDVHGTMHFRQLVDQLDKLFSDAAVHQNYPIDRLWDELGPQWQRRSSAVFDAGMTWETIGLVSSESAEKAGLDIRPLSLRSTWVKFPFWLFGQENESELGLKFTYAKAFFQEEQMESIATQFASLLEALVLDDTQTLSQVSLTDQSKPSVQNTISVDFDF